MHEVLDIGERVPWASKAHKTRPVREGSYGVAPQYMSTKVGPSCPICHVPMLEVIGHGRSVVRVTKGNRLFADIFPSDWRVALCQSCDLDFVFPPDCPYVETI